MLCKKCFAAIFLLDSAALGDHLAPQTVPLTFLYLFMAAQFIRKQVSKTESHKGLKCHNAERNLQAGKYAFVSGKFKILCHFNQVFALPVNSLSIHYFI